MKRTPLDSAGVSTPSGSCVSTLMPNCSNEPLVILSVMYAHFSLLAYKISAEKSHFREKPIKPHSFPKFYDNIESICFYWKETVSKSQAIAPNRYPVYLKFIVQDIQKEKFNNAIYNLVEKYGIEDSYKIVSILPDEGGIEENLIVIRIDVPNNNKKDAEKFLHFSNEVFVKLGLDFYPTYIEAPIVRKK